MKALDDNEKELIGQWVYSNGKFIKDEVTLRVEWLVESFLVKVASDNSGWVSLYLDKEHDNFWELTFPNSEMHGGGPPSLILISKEDAFKKYVLEK